MSCWVVPQLAAEYWALSVEQVLEAARNKDVPSKTDLGLLFIDVAPHSPQVNGAALPTADKIEEPALRLVPQADHESADEADEFSQDWRIIRAETAEQRRKPIAA